MTNRLISSSSAPPFKTRKTKKGRWRSSKYGLLLAFFIFYCAYSNLNYQGALERNKKTTIKKIVHTKKQNATKEMRNETAQPHIEKDDLGQSTKPAKAALSITSFEEFSASQNKSARNESKLTASTNEPPPEHMWLLNTPPVANTTTALKNTIAPGLQKRIPKIVHKILLQKSGELQLLSKMTPQPLREAHLSWKLKNPDYKMQYFDLKACRDYLAHYFHPVFLRAFDCLEAFSYKADLFRYLVVYREGGWYSDWKDKCLQDNALDEMSSNGMDLVFFNYQVAFFGAAPRHPVIRNTIKEALKNVQTSDYSRDAFYVTGPNLFLEEFQKHYGDEYEKYFSGKYTAFGRRQTFVYSGGKKMVLHKCRRCGSNQDWATGNNYINLYDNRQSYCEDAASLFHTTSNAVGTDLLRPTK